ncbi:cytosolic sulfotransferase 2-like [Pholidichthys leucotaenia]
MTEFFTDNWDKLQSFRARPDDVVLAAYLKSDLPPSVSIVDCSSSQVQKQSSTSLVLLVEMDSPPAHSVTPTTAGRVWASKPSSSFTEPLSSQEHEIIYVAHNPKENAVYYFHHDCMNQTQPEPGDWSSFLQDYMEGKRTHGSWYDHVNGWREKKQTYPNLHYMFYEDVVGDHGREIDGLCSFLGLTPSAEEKDQILAKTTFDNMINFSFCPIMNHKVSPFMRKGKVGVWKNHFTVSQNEEFDRDYKQKMKNPQLHFRFQH